MVNAYNDLHSIADKFNVYFEENNIPLLITVKAKVLFDLKDEDIITDSYIDCKNYLMSNDFFNDQIDVASKYKVSVADLVSYFFQEMMKKVNDNSDEIPVAFHYIYVRKLENGLRRNQRLLATIAKEIILKLNEYGYKFVFSFYKDKFESLAVCDTYYEEVIQKKDIAALIDEFMNGETPRDIAACYLGYAFDELELDLDAIKLSFYDDCVARKFLNYQAYAITEVMQKSGGYYYVDVRKNIPSSIYKNAKGLMECVSIMQWDDFINVAKEKGRSYSSIIKGFIDFFTQKHNNSVLQALEFCHNWSGNSQRSQGQKKADYEDVKEMINSYDDKVTVNDNTTEVGKENHPIQDMTSEFEQRLKKMESLMNEFVENQKTHQEKTAQVVDLIKSGGQEIKELVIESNCNLSEQIEKTKEDISEQISNVMSVLREIDDKLYHSILQGNQKDVCDLLQEKVNHIAEIIQRYDNIQIEQNVIITLAFINHPDADKYIEDFLNDIISENYKNNYINRVTEGNKNVYLAESVIGDYLVFKNNCVNIVKGLNIKQELLFDLIIDFLNVKHLQFSPTLYFDGDIFEKFTELLASSKKSVHIIMPWFKQYIIDEHYASDIEKVVKRNVQISIKYGYLSLGSNEAMNADSKKKLEESRTVVKKLKEKYPSIALNEDDSHIKAVVIDKRLVFIGSCNIFSYFYNYKKNQNHRHEVMALIQDEELAEVLVKFCEGTIKDVI